MALDTGWALNIKHLIQLIKQLKGTGLFKTCSTQGAAISPRGKINAINIKNIKNKQVKDSRKKIQIEDFVLKCSTEFVLNLESFVIES